jgi:hypothetical protein
MFTLYGNNLQGVWNYRNTDYEGNIYGIMDHPIHLKYYKCKKTVYLKIFLVQLTIN